MCLPSAYSGPIEMWSQLVLSVSIVNTSLQPIYTVFSKSNVAILTTVTCTEGF